MKLINNCTITPQIISLVLRYILVTKCLYLLDHYQEPEFEYVSGND
jgi:hypothetical protein